MREVETYAEMLAEGITALREPYRQNTIEWLESCIQRPISDLPSDLRTFLRGLNPLLRERFVLNTTMILESAAGFFGIPGSGGSPDPLVGGPVQSPEGLSPPEVRGRGVWTRLSPTS